MMRPPRQPSKFELLIKWGLKLLAFLYFFDKFFLPSHKVKKSMEGLEQPRLNLQSHEVNLLHDPKTGELALQGWEIDGEKWVTDNSHEVSRALFTP